jgi:hypothetical protein
MYTTTKVIIKLYNYCNIFMRTELLKIDRCKRILNNPELVDAEVRGIMGDLQYLAEWVFDFKDSQKKDLEQNKEELNAL